MTLPKPRPCPVGLVCDHVVLWYEARNVRFPVALSTCLSDVLHQFFLHLLCLLKISLRPIIIISSAKLHWHFPALRKFHPHLAVFLTSLKWLPTTSASSSSSCVSKIEASSLSSSLPKSSVSIWQSPPPHTHRSWRDPRNRAR